MSATGRSKRGGGGSDYFSTPSWVVRAILPHLRGSTLAMDPCAGSGAILEVLRDKYDMVRGIELVPQLAAECVGKGFKMQCADALDVHWNEPQCVVMNPPFSLAMEFVECAINQVEKGGDVAALLRINFLESKKRAAFHKYYPSDVYVLPRRPSFTEDGKSDATGYGWFVWNTADDMVQRRGNRWFILDVED